MVPPPSPLFQRLNHRQDALPDTYLIYDLNGGIYSIRVRDYPNFNIEWIGKVKPPSLTLDLTSTGTHSLILDLDYCGKNNENIRQIFDIIESVLKMTFLPGVPNLTYIIALRRNSRGIHVHLPEFAIGHDDYIILCEILQFKLRQMLKGNEIYKLDILQNAMLPGAAKPNETPYHPTRIVYVDEKETFQICLSRFDEEYESVKKKFVKRKNNEKSLFRSLMKLNNFRILIGDLQQLLMPVICSRPDAPVHTISFATAFNKHPNTSPDWEDIAQFTAKKTKQRCFISKNKKILFEQSHSLKVFHYLCLNGCNMLEFETTNHAVKHWFNRYGHSSTLDNSHIPPFFKDIHEMLQFEHTSLAENVNPIKTIMQFNNGYYFIPIFYSLCQHYQKDSKKIAEELRSLLDKEYYGLLDKIWNLNPKNIQFESMDTTINTIHFCANNLHRDQPKTHQEKLKSIVDNNQRAILSVTTQDQIMELLRSMQERHLPIRVLKLRNALKKPCRFIWNALTESWQEVTSSSEITDHMQNLWKNVKQFFNEWKQSGGLGGPDEELVNRFSVLTVVSSIMSDTAMERKDIQMDTHKWFLRLQDGVLDLLTGHIGGVVPEFFLSDRKINIGIARPFMMELCNDSPKHEAIYRQLIDKKFFLKYLQRLFLDQNENLMDALLTMVPEANDALAKSMLHFYVNLCKCTCFEHELLLYMFDILASVFIGTNYERKFFVWKGLTRNGKSKLFELLGRVLGGYYHSIQSENFAPGHSANNASPELASTLFSCRMVTAEELDKRLDENRVKQITGNSFVAFRNMYEQNSGGIPTTKVFVTTNNYPECRASHAFKDRAVAIPFDAEFADVVPETTSAQVQMNMFKKDAYVVEQSFKGSFFMLYYHLKNHMSLDDGLLHYREEPESVKEFTDDYLIHTNIYSQFRLYMDIQLKPTYTTTINEVKSAIRQFLKHTKNTSFPETELLLLFEKEFSEYRQTDMKLSGESFSYSSFAEESSTPKRTKYDLSDQNLVYYEGVIINNLRKQNIDD